MNRTSTRSQAILATAVCFFAFFLFGISDNLKGPTLPAMLAELKIEYGMGGNILFGEYVGFLIATLVTGLLADRYGLKPILLLAGVLLAAGIAGYSTFSTAGAMAASLFIAGLGFGAFELGPNAVIVNLYHEQKGLYLNLMAVMHGLGSMLAPLVTSLLFSLGTSWRDVFRWDLLLITIFIFFSLLPKFPKAEEKTSIDFRSIPRIAFTPRTFSYYAAMMFYVASEIGLASWMVVYLQDVRAVSQGTGNTYLALFFGMIMLGRFLGSFIVKRLGYLRATLTAALLAALSFSIGIFTPLTVFIPLTGFFFSIIFPTLIASISDENHENTNTILGVLFTFSGIGGMLGPWLAGWVGDFFGLQAGVSVILGLAILTFIFILLLNKRHDHEQSS